MANWCFKAAIGYKYEHINGYGKLLMRNKPLASIVTKVFEGYANGRFTSKAEVFRFLETQTAWSRDQTGRVHLQRVHELLDRTIYTGYIGQAAKPAQSGATRIPISRNTGFY